MSEAKKPKRSGYVTKAERGRRIRAIYKMLLSGAHRDEILQAIAKLEWNIAPRTADNYIAAATEMIEAEGTVDRAKEFSKAKQRLEHMYAMAMLEKDFGNARLILAELHKLLSLYMPPAPQTLKLLGIDNAQLEELVRVLHDSGHDPAAVFDRMIARAAAEKKQDADGH